MSDQPIADFANRLRVCLDADDADAALIAVSGEPAALILQDLEHFSLGGGCQLLYFLIHHPEDDEVLATMIENATNGRQPL